MIRHLTRDVFLLSLSLALLLALPLAAQQGPGQQTSIRRGFGGNLQSFFIRGQVVDDSTGKPLEGCRVMLTAFGGGYLQQEYVDSTGIFFFGDLSRGSYYVIASRQGYQEARQRVEIGNVSVPGVIIHVRPKPPKSAQIFIEPLDVDERLVPRDARKEFERGVAAAREKQWQSSLAHFNKALEIYPEYVSVLHNKSLVQLRLRDLDGAQENSRKAIALNPNAAAPRAVLGSILNAQHQYLDAAEQLARAAQLNPRSWLAHYELSRAFWGLRNLRGSEKAIIRAHELRSNVPNIHLMRANVFIARRNLEGALGELDEFLALVPDGPMADNVRQQRSHIEQQLAGSINP